MCVGQVLRERAPSTQILLCEPSNAPLLLSGVKTEYQTDGSITSESHPVFRPHLLQGWTPDFVPRMVEDSTEDGLYDELGHVSGEEAVETARELARLEGIFTGTSGGGVLACALKKAKMLPSGSSMVVMLPDTGERYLSTPLFDDVPADSYAASHSSFTVHAPLCPRAAASSHTRSPPTHTITSHTHDHLPHTRSPPTHTISSHTHDSLHRA